MKLLTYYRGYDNVLFGEGCHTLHGAISLYMSMEQKWNEINRGKQKKLKENLIHSHFVQR